MNAKRVVPKAYVTRRQQPGRVVKDADDYTPPKCGPPDGVEAEGEGANVKEAVRAATQNAIEICKLYKGCDSLNPLCLFKVSKIKLADIAGGRKKATAIGTCECGTSEVLPGD